jgi:hypothetical protein
METPNEDFYRVAVGMMALSYREMNGGSFYKSNESMESLLALLADMNPLKFEFEFRKDEDLRVVAQQAAQQVSDAASLRMALALNASALAFADFCELLQREDPSIDIPALIELLALRAARRQGATG